MQQLGTWSCDQLEKDVDSSSWGKVLHWTKGLWTVWSLDPSAATWTCMCGKSMNVLRWGPAPPLIPVQCHQQVFRGHGGNTGKSSLCIRDVHEHVAFFKSLCWCTHVPPYLNCTNIVYGFCVLYILFSFREINHSGVQIIHWSFVYAIKTQA